MTAFIVREAKPGDAAQIIAHVRQVADEPNNGIAMSSASEFTYTEEEESAIIQQADEADDKLMIVAEADGQIIGVANCNAGRGGYQHTFSLGITVHRDWRSQGVGRAMMQHMIAWCHRNPLVHRLELWVFPDNPRAIRLYENLGFQHEGNRRASFFKEGQLRDLLLMAMLFE